MKFTFFFFFWITCWYLIQFLTEVCSDCCLEVVIKLLAHLKSICEICAKNINLLSSKQTMVLRMIFAFHFIRWKYKRCEQSRQSWKWCNKSKLVLLSIKWDFHQTTIKYSDFSIFLLNCLRKSLEKKIRYFFFCIQVVVSWYRRSWNDN